MADMPRPEYPRPQFARSEWLCLNGEWQFEIDAGDSGKERGLLERELAGRIIVPFCPESELSGVGNSDFLNAVWYRREVIIPPAWAGKRVLLHFQAADYDTTVWVNGAEAARHRGGFTPFRCDISHLATAGETATIVVRCRDDHRQKKPMGKQSSRYGNAGCHYTRTTGIWQTVWLGPVPALYLLRPRLTPNVAEGSFHLVQPLSVQGAAGPAVRLRATLYDEHGALAGAEAAAGLDFAPQLTLPIPTEHRRLWAPGNPFLYDIEIELLDGEGRTIDHARSYAGLRSVAIRGHAVLINGKPVFQRLVLDQGYYPDGIMTAPSDEAMVRDIELGLAAGFNGARLHQKVFEERFLYHADRLGYLVWSEFADWHGNSIGSHPWQPWADVTYLGQWIEAMQRDYSHPSIIGWCPLNETQQIIRDQIDSFDDITQALFAATKAIDPTRPVLDTSGYSHRVAETDVYDCHDYCQDPGEFAAHHADTDVGRPFSNRTNLRRSTPYRNQPFFVSEFGGIWWNPAEAQSGREKSWGYGDRPKTIEDFYRRFEALCGILLDNPAMFGYCYTQLSDVFQEQNGIYSFDRRAKFDMGRIRAAQQKTAACEQPGASEPADEAVEATQVWPGIPGAGDGRAPILQPATNGHEDGQSEAS